MPPARASLPRSVRAYAAIVLVNYAAQVVYAADLYGTRVNLSGTALLAATFAWFVVGVAAYARGWRAAPLVLGSYALAQFAFYAVVEIGLMAAGYGMLYQLTHAHDAIVWVVFLIGDVSFVASAAFLTAVGNWRRARGRSLRS